MLFQNGTRDALRFQQAGSAPKTILWYHSTHIWFPFGPKASGPALWTMTSLSALAGALCAYPAHLWLAWRGLVDVVAQGGAAVKKSRWYEALGVILLTYTALVAGIGGALVIITGLPIDEALRLLTAAS